MPGCGLHKALHAVIIHGGSDNRPEWRGKPAVFVISVSSLSRGYEREGGVGARWVGVTCEYQTVLHS